MKQLGNQDAGFIYAETHNTPMHISGLGIYDQSTAPGGRLGHKDIIQYVQDRMHFAPIFRQKLVEVPFGIDKPYWIDDPDFDIEFHIRHIALPHPGDWRQLCILISRINSRPLDFNRPLWEAYIIEGLDNVSGLPKDSFAILVKVHHSAVDGASGQGVFGALHDLTPEAKPQTPKTPMLADRNPTNVELFSRSIGNNVSRSIGQTKSFFKEAPGILKTALKLYRGREDSGGKLKVPKTRFNSAISPHRVFEGTHFSLEDVKQVKDAVGKGTTVNDVMLCTVAGAMRKYLKHHEELPKESLTAMLPQDIRTESDRKEFGNKVGGLFAELHTNIEDPIKRLLAIHHSTAAAKKTAQEMNTAAVVQNFTGGFLNPYLGKALNRVLQSTRLIERLGPFGANTVITNVPGPNFPLYHAGAKMVAYWGLPPLMDCLGLGHAVFSYCGRISLSVTACRDSMPDPQFYIQCCDESLIEIIAAAKLLETPKKNTRRTASAKASSAKASKKRLAKSSPTVTQEVLNSISRDVNEVAEDTASLANDEGNEDSSNNPEQAAPKKRRVSRRKSTAHKETATNTDEADNTEKQS